MKLEAHVMWVSKSYYEQPRFEVWQSDMSSVGPEYVHVEKIEVDFEPPAGFDPRPAQIASLREEKKKIIAEAHVKAENIEEQIQRLLAIEFKPA